jgi:hypothetical protein
MANRQFRDSSSVVWDVWEVFPGDVPTRVVYDRRSGSRVATPLDPDLDPELEEGWLCFQSGAERRRFAPIPPKWVELPDAVLRVMLDIAFPVKAVARPSRADT